jgi:vacuolar-type H+-ATPase subunit F/Vma7
MLNLFPFFSVLICTYHSGRAWLVISSNHKKKAAFRKLQENKHIGILLVDTGNVMDIFDSLDKIQHFLPNSPQIQGELG